MSRKNPEPEDRLVESEESRKVAAMVKALPDDELSLAWRSELNAKLKALEKRKRRRAGPHPAALVGGIGASVLAAVLLLFAMMPSRSGPSGLPPSQDLERQLLTAHLASADPSEAAGEGVSSVDEAQQTASDAQDWHSEDLEPL